MHHGVPNVPLLFDGLAHRLSVHGLTCNMCDAYEYPEFVKHAVLDTDRMLDLTAKQVKQCDFFYGCKLVDHLRAKHRKVPRLYQLVSCSTIPVDNRTFSGYIWIIIAEGLSQLAPSCEAAGQQLLHSR